MLYRFNHPGQLRIIDWCCRNAAYVFDKPRHVTELDLLELRNGEFYLKRGGEEFHIEGKWTDLRGHKWTTNSQ